jgi:hypothetical protein
MMETRDIGMQGTQSSGVLVRKLQDDLFESII